MADNQYSQKIFQLLIQNFGEKNWKKKSSELLHISEDALYKKIRGESHLSIQEILAIRQVVPFSLDDLFIENENNIVFNCSELFTPRTTYKEYLRNILSNLQFASKLEDLEVFYTSNEISLFQYFNYPNLAAFKLISWSATNWLAPNSKNMDEMILSVIQDVETQEILRKICYYYNRMPSTEIWSINILDNTLNQLRWFIDSGDLLDYRLINNILQSIELLLKETNELLTHGYKIIDEELQLRVPVKIYFNEMTHTNNTILVNHKHGAMTFVTHDNPNFMITHNNKFCKITENWIKKLITKSDSLALGSEKVRKRYFNILYAKLDRLRAELNIRMVL
ncbi:MAG: hypothetical protein IPG55_07615 [Saprospiraceae bacterium]|nr:hypothetical protein [Candidatus Defluviibacterium haderslevense]